MRTEKLDLEKTAKYAFVTGLTVVVASAIVGVATGLVAEVGAPGVYAGVGISAFGAILRGVKYGGK